ncbi:MAG: helix-turn-helix domain-containing protein [Dehalococcoidia bacterium]
MAATLSLSEVEPRLRRVGQYVEELHRLGRHEDADAVAFVRELAERVLTERSTSKTHDLVTTGQAGLALGVSDQTIRNWVAAGQLPAVKRGVRTMIPRQAIHEEIARDRVQPGQAVSPSDREAGSLAWRQELLAALPRHVVERLDVLHEKLEDGQALTADERAEIVGLEHEMAGVAARYLRRVIRRGRAARA